MTLTSIILSLIVLLTSPKSGLSYPIPAESTNHVQTLVILEKLLLELTELSNLENQQRQEQYLQQRYRAGWNQNYAQKQKYHQRMNNRPGRSKEFWNSEMKRGRHLPITG